MDGTWMLEWEESLKWTHMAIDYWTVEQIRGSDRLSVGSFTLFIFMCFDLFYP